ncbi:hypothetical protein [Mucilaginibacter psychrotolerans]|uniref:Uncharacterized protein n=1 Tax=Mucilaginibacter psychrotolerans TaxID=1524096 RepID=A0A4Y8S7N5_9SPHI|nr:hypothetical protein [Mucilaginibacter psychrotolerans]TFF34580.1 hypothetical protein E2R66_21770 [Mucilaginibacter psychrotolerans]
MGNLPYSVVYQSPDGFFVCRTDFNKLENAEEFITSKIFIYNGAKFHFILKDGKELIKGDPIQRTGKFYSDSMKFAVEIPLSSFAKSS